MHAHRDLVAGFRDALRGGDLPAGLTATDPSEVARRFAVYRNTVAVTLSDALARRFPVICRLVEQAFFAAMARVYTEGHPPRSPVLMEWGDDFPAFLRGFAPLAGYPYMADVARIEYARGVAFHAADKAPAPADLLTRTDPARLVLGLHPSVAVLRLDHAAVTIWAQNKPDMPPETPQPGPPQIALILRDRGFGVPVHAILSADAVMIAQIAAGQPLLTAALAAQAADPAHDAGRLIGLLAQSGALTQPDER